MKKYTPELFEEMCVALNRSTAMLMQFSNLMLETGRENYGAAELIENNLSLLEKSKQGTMKNPLRRTRQKAKIPDLHSSPLFIKN